MNTIFNWVNNAPASSVSTRRNEVTNPATGAVIREVVLSSTDDVNQAVAAAQAAFPA